MRKTFKTKTMIISFSIFLNVPTILVSLSRNLSLINFWSSFLFVVILFLFCGSFIKESQGRVWFPGKARPRDFFSTKRKTIFSVTLLLQLRLNGILYVIVTFVFSYFLREKTHKQKKITAVLRTLNSFWK